MLYCIDFNVKFDFPWFRMSISIFLLSISSLSAQDCLPKPDKCNLDDCNNGVAIALSTDPNNVFCQGENVLMKLDPNISTAFDSVFVYWCDGTLIKYGPNTFEFSHVFNVDENKVCATSGSDYEITIVGKKYCAGKVSCRYISTPVTLKHEPRARFTYQNSVCVNKTLNFNGAPSCNEDENNPNSYLWTFHDGTTKTGKNTTTRQKIRC